MRPGMPSHTHAPQKGGICVAPYTTVPYTCPHASQPGIGHTGHTYTTVPYT